MFVWPFNFMVVILIADFSLCSTRAWEKKIVPDSRDIPEEGNQEA